MNALTVSVKPRKNRPQEKHVQVTMIELKEGYWRVYMPAHSTRCIGKVWKVDGEKPKTYRWRTDVNRLPHKTRQAALRELVNLNLVTEQ